MRVRCMYSVYHYHLSRSVWVMVFNTRLAIPSESAITICWVSFSRSNFFEGICEIYRGIG